MVPSLEMELKLVQLFLPNNHNTTILIILEWRIAKEFLAIVSGVNPISGPVGILVVVRTVKSPIVLEEYITRYSISSSISSLFVI